MSKYHIVFLSGFQSDLSVIYNRFTQLTIVPDKETVRQTDGRTDVISIGLVI